MEAPKLEAIIDLENVSVQPLAVHDTDVGHQSRFEQTESGVPLDNVEAKNLIDFSFFALTDEFGFAERPIGCRNRDCERDSVCLEFTKATLNRKLKCFEIHRFVIQIASLPGFCFHGAVPHADPFSFLKIFFFADLVIRITFLPKCQFHRRKRKTDAKCQCRTTGLLVSKLLFPDCVFHENECATCYKRCVFCCLFQEQLGDTADTLRQNDRHSVQAGGRLLAE